MTNLRGAAYRGRICAFTRLRPPLDRERVGDRVLPQRQHELSAAGRVFYCPDAAARVVWVTCVDLGHARETD